MSESPPFTHLYDLASVTEKGAELVLAPAAAELARIAAWLEIEAVEKLRATVRLTRASGGRFLYRGHFDADVVQACVVTLEPIQAHLSQDIARDYQIAPSAAARRGRKSDDLPVIDLNDDENAPEVVDSPLIDLAAPLLEELSLALDPYPRKEGVSFTPPGGEADETAADNPFAVLQRLKRN